MRIRYLYLVTLAFSACAAVRTPTDPVAADPEAISVMVLGSWHFAGSNSDLVSVETGSVLTPQRQRELAVVAERLSAFQPTVLVTERVTAPPEYIDPKFSDFTAAELETNEDERVQLGYRIAASASVRRVYGLDEQPETGEPDYFPFDKLAAHAEQTGQSTQLDTAIRRIQSLAAEEMSRLSRMTMADGLINANSGALSSPEFYYELLQLDVGETQPGAELNAYWFMRNAKIFSKLIDVTKPGDRVIMVYGAGHKFWLDHMVENTPGFRKIDPVDYLAAPAD